MKENNIVVEKSYAFALPIVKLYWHLVESKKEYRLSGQVLSSGTSVGANIEEAMGGSSRRDFKSRLDIS
ncbi:hypothetical protein SAE01_23620 [Segetibacter aerophilus]|uniref:Four helix bundle protein n=1 Tax=Segetibacter aerophilus TaxID=670293 RepID=A0A512BD21_9BACT|nr:hypothetical protein SAE01_23620 [Segetibacter aerophilus]